jgi:hypothetical protein
LLSSRKRRGSCPNLSVVKVSRCSKTLEWIGRFLARELVLLVDLRVGPAPRTIELRHHHLPVVQPHLVDAVLVAVEAEEAPVGRHAGGVDGVEHAVRRELAIRMRAFGMRVHG